MLPFLSKIKKASGIAGTIIKQRQPDEKTQEDQEYSIEDCAQDLINAVHAHDKDGVVQAMRDIFENLEKAPHEEGPHIQPHSYEAQKED